MDKPPSFIGRRFTDKCFRSHMKPPNEPGQVSYQIFRKVPSKILCLSWSYPPQAPFFAGEKVPSPIACDRSSSFRRSMVLISRSHARTSNPASVHSLCRRQQVAKEGYRSGKSCHRAPVFNTQRTPSIHRRESTRGRPPSGDGSGLSNKSLIRFLWISVTKGFGAVLDPVVFGRRR